MNTIKPEHDFRGLSKKYMERRAQGYFLSAVLWAMFGGVASYSMVMLATSEHYGASVIVAALAAFCWFKVIRQTKQLFQWMP